MNHTARFLKVAEAARQRINETTISAIKERLDRGDPFHLIDVREDHEWDGGRIPGAMHLGRGIIERDIEENIADIDADIVVYCGGGYRSAMVADQLQKMGYTHVLSMDGGYRDWTEAGHPTVQ
jgi:rhodanese-related sulfurtransferase